VITRWNTNRAIPDKFFLAAAFEAARRAASAYRLHAPKLKAGDTKER
jgi:hypothetical protein